MNQSFLNHVENGVSSLYHLDTIYNNIVYKTIDTVNKELTAEFAMNFINEKNQQVKITEGYFNIKE